MNWIPCSKRLPETDDNVFLTEKGTSGNVYTDIGSRFIMHKIDDKYYDGRYYFSPEILAWMPLPEPYQGGQA